MLEKEDLGLSLSLSFGVSSNQTSLQLNLMPCSSSPSPFTVINKASWTDAFTSSGTFFFFNFYLGQKQILFLDMVKKLKQKLF